MADWIDHLVEWQIQQGIRSGEYQPPPKPPAVRNAIYVLRTNIRRVLPLGRR